MSTKVIISGINRSGTKLASYLIAKACNLRYICFEPFYWQGGIDASLGDDWSPHIRSRTRSKSGKEEHERLPVYCNGTEKSPWLHSLLNEQKWDLVKFVEIGRVQLYHTICPDAFHIGLIRDPVGQFCSLKGSTIQKNYVVDQWKRLRKELKGHDPLPGAEQWLSNDMAACARLYAVLYTKLKHDLPEGSLRVSYDELSSSRKWLVAMSNALKANLHFAINVPPMGVSTRQDLSEHEHRYIIDSLMPVYNSFLEKDHTKTA